MILLLLLPLLAAAQLEVKYLHNYDGDTITFNVGKVRVLGIDSGELRSKKPCEKASGLEAKAFVEARMKKATKITLTEYSKKDIYGRTLAHVHYDGKNLAEELLDAKLAVKYVPKKYQRVNWCKLQEQSHESKKL